MSQETNPLKPSSGRFMRWSRHRHEGLDKGDFRFNLINVKTALSNRLLKKITESSSNYCKRAMGRESRVATLLV